MNEFRVALLWGTVLACIFLGVSCAVWLFATSVETCTLSGGSGTGVVSKSCESHRSDLIAPAILLTLGLVALGIASIARRRALRAAIGRAPSRQ